MSVNAAAHSHLVTLDEAETMGMEEGHDTDQLLILYGGSTVLDLGSDGYLVITVPDWVDDQVELATLVEQQHGLSADGTEALLNELHFLAEAELGEEMSALRNVAPELHSLVQSGQLNVQKAQRWRINGIRTAAGGAMLDDGYPSEWVVAHEDSQS